MNNFGQCDLSLSEWICELNRITFFSLVPRISCAKRVKCSEINHESIRLFANRYSQVCHLCKLWPTTVLISKTVSAHISCKTRLDSLSDSVWLGTCYWQLCGYVSWYGGSDVPPLPGLCHYNWIMWVAHCSVIRADLAEKQTKHWNAVIDSDGTGVGRRDEIERTRTIEQRDHYAKHTRTQTHTPVQSDSVV